MIHLFSFSKSPRNGSNSILNRLEFTIKQRKCSLGERNQSITQEMNLNHLFWGSFPTCCRLYPLNQCWLNLISLWSMFYFSFLSYQRTLYLSVAHIKYVLLRETATWVELKSSWVTVYICFIPALVHCGKELKKYKILQRKAKV